MASSLFSLEAERCALGAMMCSRDSRDDILALLVADDFYEKNSPNQLIFKAIEKITNDGVEVSIASLSTELGANMKVLEKVGGIAYLTELQDCFIGETDAYHHAKSVKDLSLARNLIDTMNKCVNELEKKEIKDVGSYVSYCSDQILKITEERKVGEFKYIGEVITGISEELKISPEEKKKKQRNVMSGYRKLDRLTHGWAPGQFNIVGARPSVGKTAFALNLAYNAAVETNKTIAFFSLEMDANSICRRLVSIASRVPSSKFDDTEKMSSDDWMALEEGIKALKKCKLMIDDTPNEKINNIKTKVHKLVATNPDLCCIFIDYLGLITTNGRAESRQQEVSEISRTLKGLAREVNVPIICLSQLSRDNEKRNNGERMPKLTDLRDSGSIEQDADIVMFVHREDYQNEKALKEKEQTQTEESFYDPLGNISETTINIAKNRQGSTGFCKFSMLMNIGRFEEIITDTNEIQQ